eukprot:2980179-Rhodomonas_salina.1
MLLPLGDAMSSTEMGYAATRPALREDGGGLTGNIPLWCYAFATRCPVLRWATLLPVLRVLLCGGTDLGYADCVCYAVCSTEIRYGGTRPLRDVRY